jgi:hypothetical protein
VNWEEVAPLLDDAVAKEAEDPATSVLGATAAATARAAWMLARRYTLVTTNVPYLTGKSMAQGLAQFCERVFPLSKGDLAAVFLERSRDLADPTGGSLALVTTQNWLSLSSYRRLRESLLSRHDWNMLARLGPGAFGAISGEVVQPILTVHSNATARDQLVAIDCYGRSGALAKETCLIADELLLLSRAKQLSHPDARIVLGDLGKARLLSEYASSYAGIQSGDYSRFGRFFWEMPHLLPGWEFQQSTVATTRPYGGREHCFLWEDGKGAFYRFVVNG